MKRELIQLLLDQNIDDRINITEPLRVYMSKVEVPEIVAVRSLVQGLRFCAVAVTGLFASKLAPTVDRMSSCGSELAREEAR